MGLKNYAYSLFLGTLFLSGCWSDSSTNRSSKKVVPVADHVESVDENKDKKSAKLNQEASGQGHAYHEFEKKNFVTIQERRDLFKKLGINYLEQTVIDYAPLLRMNMKETERYVNDPISNDVLTKFYGADIENKKLAPISVRWLGKDVGYGVFAEADIEQDGFIGIYTGVVMDRKKVDSKDYAWAYPATTLEGTRISLDAKFEGNELRFINHSYNPNSVVRFVIGFDGLWHVCYVASKPIKKGQQIVVSYGKKYWESRQYEYREINP